MTTSITHGRARPNTQPRGTLPDPSGDSFDDDIAVAELPQEEKPWIATLQAGRTWVWIEGNHDPGPVSLGGSHWAVLRLGPLSFRHIARPDAAPGEVSGHSHSKVGLRVRGGHAMQRPAFLIDGRRVILPAFGTYTGGLRCTDPMLQRLIGKNALVVVTGARAMPLPMPQP